MRKLINVGLILGIAGATLILGANGALAECESFTITAVPNPVQEGGETTATVSRSTNADKVSIDVDGISSTAQSGTDFEPVDRTVMFEENGVTSVSFKVKIVKDNNKEPAEQFRLRLSNVKGCPPGDSFDTGADEIVRIVASTGSTPSPTTSPAATSTPGASSTTTPDATTSPSPSPTVSPSPTPSAGPTFTPFPTATPDGDDDEGTSALAIAGILVAAAAVVAGIALLLWVRRAQL
jgi:hypothetical protein